jgi:hypothetical protein
MEQKKLRQLRKQRGSALVESAFVLTTVIFMMISIMDFAQFLFIHQSLVEAGRRATRYGVANPYDEQGIRNIVLYDSVIVPTGGQPRFGLESSMVDVSRFDAGTTSDRIQVKIVNYRFQVYTPLIAGTLQGLPITTTLPYEAN